MPFWTYMLRCSDGLYYTGHTEDLERRVGEHRTGALADCWTFRRRPVELVWSEELPTRIEALEAERRFGGWSKAKKEALIRGDWGSVSHFARPPRKRAGNGPEPRFSTGPETNGSGEPFTRTPFASSPVEKRCSEQAASGRGEA